MNLYLSIISVYEYLRGLAVLGRNVVYAGKILKTLFTIIPLTEKPLLKLLKYMPVCIVKEF